MNAKRHALDKPTQAILVACLLTGLLLSSLDTSIVSTSLITISHDLSDFVNAPWIILAYLLTYMGFAVFVSRLSDVYGRKTIVMFSWTLFVAFSLGCASAQSMMSLIICRAFQGIGASGLYSLTQISILEVGPAHRPSLIGAMIGATLAVAFVLGPIVGGTVSQLSSWRWLFNMNIPVGLVVMLILANFWPHDDAPHILSLSALRSIDFLGSIALLLGSGLLVFAMQQAGSWTMSWADPVIISSLVLSCVSWAAFVYRQMRLGSNRKSTIEPIFPVRLMSCRVYLSGLLVTFLTGFSYIALCVELPERFQIIYSQNSLIAGVHVLPLLAACAFGSFLGGAISSKSNKTSYTLIAASLLQLLGVSLLSLSSSEILPSQSQYVFQAIFGLGVGLSLSASTIITSLVATGDHERAAAQGAVAQARVLGGCLGLSTCTIIYNSRLGSFLSDTLTSEQLSELRRFPVSETRLPTSILELVQTIHAVAYTEEFKVMAMVCIPMVAISLFTLESSPASLALLGGPKRAELPLSGR
ncbi:hypothetical protein VHEMI09135 [[Torrubiella] hemipterigena]|uniref:Major facilitator superfamily (MFS) profile domain-containing protein n=1 Tax=[Torrubiella] hemipterigena TaxID=1531966 RepID=A0A0A1TPH2_9HYPO|nr:hypothetical protein VHEMI09135 [[Torrubiella] hemipterigena]